MIPHAMELTTTMLDGVRGGQDASFGRCGPGASWGFLGNHYTPQCAAHDGAVRSGIASGQSKVEAHVRALPLLPAAIGSWVGAKLGR